MCSNGAINPDVEIYAIESSMGEDYTSDGSGNVITVFTGIVFI